MDWKRINEDLEYQFPEDVCNELKCPFILLRSNAGDGISLQLIIQFQDCDGTIYQHTSYVWRITKETTKVPIFIQVEKWHKYKKIIRVEYKKSVTIEA